MANQHTTLSALFSDIADVIRNKTGITGEIPATEFPERILDMSKDLFTEIATGEVTSIKAKEIEGLTTIPDYSFTGCKKLTAISIPSSVTSIANNAFYGCSVKSINVPWAEGAVANAPWGAPSATITYNYSGE